MKLILCKSCQDIFKVYPKTERKCFCGLTSAIAIDEVNIEYSGEYAVPIGFHNTEFRTAVINQPYSGMGYEFKAFVIPKNVPSCKKI